MKNRELLEEIKKHADLINLQLERLSDKPDQVHELDVELLSEKVKEIYTLIHSLATGDLMAKKENVIVREEQKVPLVKVESNPEAVPTPTSPEINPPDIPDFTAQEPPPDPAPEPDPPAAIETKPEPVVEPDPEPEPEPEVKMEAEPDPEIKSEVKLETEPEPVPTPEPEPEIKTEVKPEPEPEIEPIIDPPPQPQSKTTADLFTGATTIADSFQKEEDKSIAARVVPQGVSDLKKAIGINDKFLFINELFKGSPDDYNQAIDSLNAFESDHEASSALNTYRQEYAWPDNSEAYHRLKKIVLSKYSGS